MAVMSDADIRTALGALPGWSHSDGAVSRDFTFDDFMGSVGFVNRLAEMAEAENHHPDLAISWATVTVSWCSHSEGGVTDRDLAMASATDSLG